MQHFNLSHRISSEPWAILPSALRDLSDKRQAYLTGRIAAPLPKSLYREDIVGPLDCEGNPVIPQLEIVNGVAIIRVTGVLATGVGWLDACLCGAYDYNWLGTFLAQALADPSVQDILTAMDSPGGSHVGMEECGALIARARAQKRIITFSSGMLCSAAYALAVQSDAIITTPSAMVGSLGSKLIADDTSAMAAQMGLARTAFTSGAQGQELPLKAAGEDGLPLTQPQRDFYRATTQYAGQWVNTVTQRRPQATGVSFEGGWVFGSQAIPDGLVDSLALSLEEAIAQVILSRPA